jgi:hypothetical protein
MIRLLPASTNSDYRGAISSAWFLGLTGAASLVTGLIHFGLPDGGAGVIAGIDLSQNGDTVIAAFSWIGALQIPYGVLLIVMALRFRPFVPLLLLLIVVERGLMAVDGWFLKGAGGHHPPEHFVNPVIVAAALVFLHLSLRRKRADVKPEGAHADCHG